VTDTTVKYIITNDHPEALTVLIEPWAEEIVLRPTSSLLLTVLCDREGMLEVATDPNYFTVWFWTGCRVKLALNGEELVMPSLLRRAP
jgi:hypothetical protein